jgi:hypothetical protein
MTDSYASIIVTHKSETHDTFQMRICSDSEDGSGSESESDAWSNPGSETKSIPGSDDEGGAESEGVSDDESDNWGVDSESDESLPRGGDEIGNRFNDEDSDGDFVYVAESDDSVSDDDSEDEDFDIACLISNLSQMGIDAFSTGTKAKRKVHTSRIAPDRRVSKEDAKLVLRILRGSAKPLTAVEIASAAGKPRKFRTTISRLLHNQQELSWNRKCAKQSSPGHWYFVPGSGGDKGDADDGGSKTDKDKGGGKGGSDGAGGGSNMDEDKGGADDGSSKMDEDKEATDDGGSKTDEGKGKGKGKGSTDAGGGKTHDAGASDSVGLPDTITDVEVDREFRTMVGQLAYKSLFVAATMRSRIDNHSTDAVDLQFISAVGKSSGKPYYALAGKYTYNLRVFMPELIPLNIYIDKIGRHCQPKPSYYQGVGYYYQPTDMNKMAISKLVMAAQRVSHHIRARNLTVVPASPPYLTNPKTFGRIGWDVPCELSDWVKIVTKEIVSDPKDKKREWSARTGPTVSASRRFMFNKVAVDIGCAARCMHAMRNLRLRDTFPWGSIWPYSVQIEHKKRGGGDYYWRSAGERPPKRHPKQGPFRVEDVTNPVRTFARNIPARVLHIAWTGHARFLYKDRKSKQVTVFDPWMQMVDKSRRAGNRLFELIKSAFEAEGYTVTFQARRGDQGPEGSCTVQALMRVLMMGEFGISGATMEVPLEYVVLTYRLASMYR